MESKASCRGARTLDENGFSSLCSLAEVGQNCPPLDFRNGSLPDRLMVGQRPLEAFILVRIQVRQQSCETCRVI